MRSCADPIYISFTAIGAIPCHKNSWNIRRGASLGNNIPRLIHIDCAPEYLRIRRVPDGDVFELFRDLSPVHKVSLKSPDQPVILFCDPLRIEQVGKKLIRVSVRRPLPGGLYFENESIMRAADGGACAIAKIGGIGSLRGMHNAQNAACAAGAALALGLSAQAIQRGLASFPGLAHRMEEVGRKARVLFVNDSKATNADSAAQALACFSDIFWIAGGRAKTGGIASLGSFFPRIRKAYLIGEAATDFAAELEGRVPHAVVGTLERAIERAAADAETSEVREPVVLLSPACASFDQYRNFELRGDKFRELVRALPGLMPPQSK